MAGIKFLEKNMIQVNYIINQLLAPEIHQRVFDDSVGINEIVLQLYDMRTIIYGIFEQGKPEPIGAVWFDNVMPYRNATLSAVIFDPKNRAQHKLSPLFEKIKFDIIKRYSIHSFSSYVILPNETSEAILGKLGFKKVGLKEKYVFANGQYRDVALYYRLATEV